MSGPLRRSGTWSGLLALAFMLGACGFGINGAPFRPPNSCTSDADCDEGRCDVEERMCISAPADALRVGLEVAPADADPDALVPKRATFAARILDDSVPSNLRLPASIMVFGDIRTEGGEPVPANLIFARPAAFEGALDSEASTNTSPDPLSPRAGESADYALRVVAERTYSVSVEPSGEAMQELPPLQLEDVVVPGGGDLWRFDIAYPNELPELTGELVNHKGKGVSDLVVRAISADQTRAVSSSAVTDEAGLFSLRFSDTEQDFLIRVSAGSERPTFPTIEIDPAFLLPEGDEPVSILVPDFESVAYSGWVAGEEGAAAARDPACEREDRPHSVSAASLAFRSNDVLDVDTGIRGSFQLTVGTDSCGGFSAQLVPGTYDVVVTPGDGTLGVWHEELEIKAGAGTDNRVFFLPVRAQLAGRILATGKKPLANVSVQGLARRVELTGTKVEDVARYNRSNETVTDRDGIFALRLDHGLYDLVVKPPIDSGFGWLVKRDLRLTEESADSGVITFMPPVPLEGVVTTAEGELLVGAEIRAYGIVERDGSSAAIQIGRGVTDEAGHYRLILPPKL